MGNPTEGLGEKWIAKNGAAKTWFSPSKLSGDLREFAGMGDTQPKQRSGVMSLHRIAVFAFARSLERISFPPILPITFPALSQTFFFPA
jgi:hypothetical protein